MVAFGHEMFVFIDEGRVMAFYLENHKTAWIKTNYQKKKQPRYEHFKIWIKEVLVFLKSSPCKYCVWWGHMWRGQILLGGPWGIFVHFV